MKRYEYKIVTIEISAWTSRAKHDYLEVLNENGKEGWRFIEFSRSQLRPKGVKGVELLFEREIEEIS